MAVLVTVVVVAAAGLAIAAVGGAFDGGEEPAAPSPAPSAASADGMRVDRFDSARAFADLRYQVELGPRPAGSEASRGLAEWIREQLPRGRFEPLPGGLRNVVGRLSGARPAIVLAAHYDTKDIPGFVGANDAAGGTAALLELVRVLRRIDRPRGAPEIRFVFFDGEESPDDSRPFYTSGLRGSRPYAARHEREVAAMILLDFVAEKGLRIPRETGSDTELWQRLRAAARRVGAGAAFPDEEVGEILDDHTPFARRGIPAIDLIDFTFSCWHRPCDDLSVVSERSLDLSGEAVLELVRTWR